MSRKIFYKNQIINNIKNKDSKILVLGAGQLDNQVFTELNYTNVTFFHYYGILIIYRYK